MDKMLNTEDMVSALADGQLRGEDFAQAVQAVSTQEAARAQWHSYHVIGDVLRSAELAPAGSSEAFMRKLQGRLQNEQPPVAAPVTTVSAASMTDTAIVRGHAANAANAGSFRWKIAAGVASLAAVVATGWNVAGLGIGQPAQPVLAQMTPAREATAVASAVQPVMIRDARLDELMAAHRQSGGASALQMPAGFLRSATFEAPAR